MYRIDGRLRGNRLIFRQTAIRRRLGVTTQMLPFFPFPFKANLCTQIGSDFSSPFKGKAGRGMGERGG